MNDLRLRFTKKKSGYVISNKNFDRKELDYVFEYLIEAINLYISPYWKNKLNKEDPSVSTDQLRYKFYDNKCIINSAFLFAVKDEEKQEIYNDDVIFDKEKLIEVIRFFDHMSQVASNEEIGLSKDDNNIYITSDQKSYVLPYQCRTSITKYHYLTDEDAEDFDSHDCQNDQ